MWISRPYPFWPYPKAARRPRVKCVAYSNPEIALLVFESHIESLPRVSTGKVRDIYAVGEEHLLLVTSDRLSAFDVVLPDPIPGKGMVLNALSIFWFQRLAAFAANQLTGIDPESVVANEAERAQVRGRSLVVRRLQPLPVEAVVRGYLAGSGWKDYQHDGAICSITLPAGLSLAARLPEPIFTPATKAPAGDHDENIDFASCERMLGAARAAAVRALSLTLYREAATYAETRGIVIADTKFEFGLDAQGELVWIDEALTPDSSRFWPAADYRPGTSPPSYDKQYVRDYLETLDWNKSAPGPRLPASVIQQTAAKYRSAYTALTGRPAPTDDC